MMVNYNIYKVMEESLCWRSRRTSGRVRRVVAAPARARVPRSDPSAINELHGAAIAQNLEQNLPQAVDALVGRAIAETLQADEDQDQEQPCTVQDLHGTITRSLQHTLHGVIRDAVMSALHPELGPEKPGKEEQTTEEEQPTPEEQLIPEE